MKKSNIVVIGGGTGLSNLLRGLKHFPVNIKAIVSVADDGGSTGMLRKEYDIPAPGDIRNVMVSLSRNESIIEEMFQYRFQAGDLKGQCLGNIMLTGMLGITGSMSKAAASLSAILDMCGEVIPVSDESLQLCAKLSNGDILKGESIIGQAVKSGKIRIEDVFYDKKVNATQEALNAIKEADYIIFGIGSLYTSIVPNLIIEDIRNEIKNSNAEKIYVCNVMQQPGETIGYDSLDHVNAVEKHLKSKVDTVFVNKDFNVPSDVMKKYYDDNVDFVEINNKLSEEYNVIRKNLLSITDGYIRHNNMKLGMAIYSYILGED